MGKGKDSVKKADLAEKECVWGMLFIPKSKFACDAALFTWISCLAR